MLTNFLDALDDTGASKKLKRVILVTGAKQYGLHLGRTKNPMQESGASKYLSIQQPISAEPNRPQTRELILQGVPQTSTITCRTSSKRAPPRETGTGW